jgi:hypothetical protein
MSTRFLLLLSIMTWLFIQSDAWCPGTIFYRTENQAGIYSFTVHPRPGAVVIQGSMLASTDDANAGIGSSDDYLCYIVTSTSTINCYVPSTGEKFGSDIPPTLFTDARIQVSYSNNHIATERDSPSSDGMALHAIQDDHNGLYPSQQVAYEPTLPRNQAFVLVQDVGRSYLYRYRSEALAMDVWQARTINAFGAPQTLTADPVSTLAVAGNKVYGFLPPSRFYSIGISDSSIPSPSSVTLPNLQNANIVSIDFASTDMNCTDLLVYGNGTSQSWAYFFNPVTQIVEPIFNTSNKIAFLSWSNMLLNPLPPAPPVVPPLEPALIEPPTPPPTSDSGCNPPKPQPEASFTCDPLTHLWTSSASIESVTVSISNPVVIVGDLNVSSTITFNGLGSLLNVTGCIDLKGNVEVILSGEELKNLEKTKEKTQLLVVSGCSRSSLDETLFVVSAPSKKKCQRIEAKSSSTVNTLSVVLNYNGNKCNTWWIIVASVIGGLVLITVVTIALLATLNSKVKNKFRPYWARNKHENPPVTS